MKNKSSEKCENCDGEDLCYRCYGKSLGLTDEQIFKFRKLVVRHIEKLKTELLGVIFGKDVATKKKLRPGEKIDMEYLQKHFNLPDVFQLAQAADILREHKEQCDLAAIYQDAFLGLMLPKNREIYEHFLRMQQEKALAVRALVMTRGHQLEAAFLGKCPFAPDRQCQTCWVAQACKIKAAEKI